MPLSDLQLYQRHTSRRGLPGQRLELLLAQVALVLAQVNGNKGVTLRDFLFEPPEDAGQDEPTDPEQAAKKLAAFFGYAPRKRRGTPQPDNNRDTTDGQQPG